MVTRIKQDICILCLTDNKKIQIHSIFLNDYDGILVEEKLKYIFEFLNFKPRTTANICTDCLKELDNVYKFKQKCSQNLISYMNDIIPENEECNNFVLTATNAQCELTEQNYKPTNALGSNAKVKEEIIETTSEDNFTIKLEPQDLDEDTVVQCPTVLFDEINSEGISKYECEDDDSGAFVNINDEIDVNSDPLLLENPVNLVAKFQNGTTNNTGHTPPPTPSGKKKLLYKCLKCRKIFSQKQDITDHKCSGRKTATFDCEVCDTPFSTQELLKKHLRSHKSKQIYICNYCDKVCNTRYNFIVHKRIHTGYKAHKCQQCGKAFTQKNHLTSHTRFHEKSTPFICFICEKGFNNEAELIRHNRMHPEEEHCRCDICGVSFRSINQMKLHRHVHYDRKFKCDLCEKAFFSENNFIKHKFTHSAERPFKCDQCDAAVATSHRLAIHKKMHFKKIINVAASS